MLRLCALDLGGSFLVLQISFLFCFISIFFNLIFVLFCFVLFCFVLFCFVLFYFLLFLFLFAYILKTPNLASPMGALREAERPRPRTSRV